jgi:methionyl-tRNA formyltransferase
MKNFCLERVHAEAQSKLRIDFIFHFLRISAPLRANFIALFTTFAAMIEVKLKQNENKATTFNFVVTSLRIVFMGTPEFAVASLDALVKAGYNIVGVITAPDKPGGRGMQMQQSAVKKYAVEHNLKVLQPEKLKNPEFLTELKSLNADLQIVVAFRMLPEVVWNMPPMGSVNLHGSLLPQYRGAAPINWAVINGEKETGVTTFKLKHEIDTGDILLQESFAIGENDTAGEVHDTMKEIGAQLLVKTIKGLADGSLIEKPQLSTVNSPLSTLHHAPKIFTETCKIDFTKTVAELHNLIRGLSPFPGAFTILDGKTLKIYKSEKQITAVKTTAGNYETDGKTFLKFACADGYILVKELQLEGKKKMLVEDFLRGYRFAS